MAARQVLRKPLRKLTDPGVIISWIQHLRPRLSHRSRRAGLSKRDPKEIPRRPDGIPRRSQEEPRESRLFSKGKKFHIIRYASLFLGRLTVEPDAFQIGEQLRALDRLHFATQTRTSFALFCVHVSDRVGESQHGIGDELQLVFEFETSSLGVVRQLFMT